jgi:hypothetical protein
VSDAGGRPLPGTLSEATLAQAEAAPRTENGTILPPTLVPDTDARRLVANLPHLDVEATAAGVHLQETIGEGGMGLIRAALQRSVNRRVAVKSLRPERATPQYVLHLLREAWVTGGLEHPNIVPVHDVGLDAQGLPLIVMKRISGTAWSEYIHDETKDLRWHLHILTQVANAVEFAGSRGIVHRDLKPANVMIGPFGEVYVLDWGIAVSLTGDAGGRLPRAQDVHGVAGTPGYMAPEMVSDTGEALGIHTDVYLLGAILHEVVMKARRHPGRTLFESLFSSAESRPFEYPAYVPLELQDILLQATARRPEERFETAGALRDALLRFLEHDSSRALTEQAEARVAAWAALEDGADPVAVQSLFQEARFGFHQALREWPENRAARAGLDGCLARKFEYDLGRDDFEAASVTLAELSEHRPEQKERLQALGKRMESRRRELTALRDLQASRNLDVGRRTRAFLMTLAALALGLIPPGALWTHRAGLLDGGYAYFYVTGVAKLVAAGALAVWARESLSKTLVNRQLTAAIFLLLVTELAIRPFAQRLGHPVAHSLFIDFGIYALVNAALAITVDRRLMWTPLFYVVGALASYLWVDGVLYLLGATHFVAYSFVAAVWRPATLLRTPEERAALAREARRGAG